MSTYITFHNSLLMALCSITPTVTTEILSSATWSRSKSMNLFQIVYDAHRRLAAISTQRQPHLSPCMRWLKAAVSSRLRHLLASSERWWGGRTQAADFPAIMRRLYGYEMNGSHHHHQPHQQQPQQHYQLHRISYKTSALSMHRLTAYRHKRRPVGARCTTWVEA